MPVRSRADTLDPASPATTDSAVVVSRRRALPNRRAVIGGLLVAIAAVGVFVAARGRDSRTQHRVAVAAHDVAAGATIRAADVDYPTLELSDAVAPQLFADDDAAAVVGRTASAGLTV